MNITPVLLKNMRKVFVFILITGIVLFLLGLFLNVPNTYLRTYGEENNPNYSLIEEYVGGDAYNFIIGASLVGAQITGSLTQKAIFICFGIFFICASIAAICFINTLLPSMLNADDKANDTDIKENIAFKAIETKNIIK